MAAGVLIHQLIVEYLVIFDYILTKLDKRIKKKRNRKMSPRKRNFSITYGTPTALLSLNPFKRPPCR
jgi:hypothetical protein